MPEQLYPVGTKILLWRTLAPAGEVVRATATSVWTSSNARLVASTAGGLLRHHGGSWRDDASYVVEGSRAHQDRIKLLGVERDRAAACTALDEASHDIANAAAPIAALLRRVATSDGALDDRLTRIRRIRDAAVAALAAVEAEHG